MTTAQLTTARTAWECVIVGGGPAGLSAAVYMGRFRRATLLIDSGGGRWTYGQHNDNYLGFPRGVSARKLRDLGVAQAARFGVELREGRVTAVARQGDDYTLTLEGQELRATTLIWAAGVRDIWPDFPGARRLVGKHLFWCIVCDGWRTRGKRVLLLGNDDHAAGTALQFLTYTRDLTFLVDPEGDCLSKRAERKLRAAGVEVRRARVRRVELRGGETLSESRPGLPGHAVERAVECVRLQDGAVLRADLLFGLYGSHPNTELLRDLGVDLARNGHVRINEKNQTNLPTFFAAGDVTNKHSHQVVSAAHEGAQAAQAANHVLYPEAQRLDPLRRDQG